MLVQTRRRTAALLVLAIAVAGGGAATSTAQQTTTPTFSILHIAAAREAIAASGFGASLDQIVPGIAANHIAIFSARNPGAVDAITAVVTQLASEQAGAKTELDRTIQRIWASNFTEAELRELIAFYATPLGQRLSESLPRVFGSMNAAVSDWGADIDNTMYQAAQTRLAAQGILVQ